MRGRLVAVAFILIIFGFALGSLQQGYFDAGIEGGSAETQTDTVAVDEGNVTDLVQSNREGLVYGDIEDVNVSQGGNDFISDGNWTWNQHNGTIRWEENTSLTDGNNADVTYLFAVTTGDQRVIRDLSLIPISLLGDEWLMLAIIILIFGAAALLGRT